MIVSFAGGILLFLIAMGFILWKDFAYAESPPYSKSKDQSSVLVVYYSRSGNTEIMAKEIAKKYNADILALQAEAYPQTFKGWRKASQDASEEVRLTKIIPEKVDLSSYKLVFLGSPIWWYRPAPPLWAFVSQNNMKGNSIVLFNTFNSRFKEEHIEKFKNEVKKQGGSFIDHIFIRRGRVINQLSNQELILEVHKVLSQKENIWSSILSGKSDLK